jgi:hypothetical protein
MSSEATSPVPRLTFTLTSAEYSTSASTPSEVGVSLDSETDQPDEVFDLAQ